MQFKHGKDARSSGSWLLSTVAGWLLFSPSAPFPPVNGGDPRHDAPPPVMTHAMMTHAMMSAAKTAEAHAKPETTTAPVRPPVIVGVSISAAGVAGRHDLRLGEAKRLRTRLTSRKWIGGRGWRRGSSWRKGGAGSGGPDIGAKRARHIAGHFVIYLWWSFARVGCASARAKRGQYDDERAKFGHEQFLQRLAYLVSVLFIPTARKSRSTTAGR